MKNTIRLLFVFLLAMVTVSCFAQGTVEDSIATAITGLSPQQQIYVMWAYTILGLIGKIIAAARNGGGLRYQILSVWFGTTVPKPIAEDYKQELQNTKTP